MTMSETGHHPVGSPSHPADLRDCHTGDLARVTGEDHELDPAAVLAVWPWDQKDFSPERHAADLYIRERRVKDCTVDTPTWETERTPLNRGMRVTFSTGGGTWYAAVDWTQTEDPALLYLLVIDDPDPGARRWERVDRVERVELYGVDPGDRSPEWTGRLPSKDIPPWEVEQDAEPDFSGLELATDD